LQSRSEEPDTRRLKRRENTGRISVPKKIPVYKKIWPRQSNEEGRIRASSCTAVGADGSRILRAHGPKTGLPESWSVVQNARPEKPRQSAVIGTVLDADVPSLLEVKSTHLPRSRQFNHGLRGSYVHLLLPEVILPCVRNRTRHSKGLQEHSRRDNVQNTIPQNRSPLTTSAASGRIRE
jgi:hypothetical protein